MSSEYDDDLGRIISHLEEALEIQENTEGEIAKTPTVAYCFDCDDITVDEMIPDECMDHKTVSGDKYEHNGIDSAITALQFVRSITSMNQDRHTSDNNG